MELPGSSMSTTLNEEEEVDHGRDGKVGTSNLGIGKHHKA
jgi:hypothetical protein